MQHVHDGKTVIASNAPPYHPFRNGLQTQGRVCLELFAGMRSHVTRGKRIVSFAPRGPVASSRFFLIAALTMGPLSLVSPSSSQTGIPSAWPGSPVSSALEQGSDKRAIEGDGAVNIGQLTSVLGQDIRNRDEDDMGRIIDVLVDGSGRVQTAVVEFGGFLGIGTRKIAIAWSALAFQSSGQTSGKKPKIVLDMRQDQLRTAQEYKPELSVASRKSE